MTAQESNLAAECRALEEGHRLRLTEDGASVVSDSTPGVRWIVEATPTAVGAGVMFHCHPDRECENGHGDRWSRSPGRGTCKHSSVLARSMERHGLVRWDHGLWVATDKGGVKPPLPLPADPFEGLP